MAGGDADKPAKKRKNKVTKMKTKREGGWGGMGGSGNQVSDCDCAFVEAFVVSKT